ncbi:G-protein coupled receptor GRL101-like protein, partial [Trichoplax sp. H2]
NGIKNLDFLKFVPSLEKLLARSNKINTLSHKIFNPLKNLKTLDVSSNPIHHLSYEAFSKLSNLYNLYLENIRLRRLDQINLTNSSNLQSLILRNNEITDLQRRNFEGLRELRLLDLSKNGISYIPNDTFVPLKNLTTLLFDDNRLTEFDASIICENTNIKELSFQSNQIHTMVDKSCIGGYKRLNIINFNNNSLDDRFSRALNAIKSEVLINLYDLNIGRNKIAHFPEVLLRATKSNLRFINIGFNKIGRIDVTKIISGFQYFNYIECKTNKRRICRYYSLNIAGSNLSYLESGTFAHIQDSMGALNLNDNKLKRLDISDLVNITNDILKHLHLANNYLTTITTKNNIQLKALSHLNLINNKIIDICWGSSLSTGAPNVQNLFSTREYLCCIVPPTVSYCTPYIEQDAFTTCSDILSHQSLQLFVWVVGSLALVGNAIVIYFQIFKVKKSSEPVPAMLITNLAFSDLMMAGYILIIGSVDLFYRNYYAANAEIWLRSFTCILACFLCCTASLMSVFMMITISIDRYIYIAFPYSNKNLSPSLTKWIITILWIFSIVFVSIPVGYSINANGDMRLYEYTSICMASNYNNYYYRIWLISYVVITLICWLITCFLYVHMFIAIYRTSKAVSAVSHNNSKRIAIRLFAIVITDLISWLPYYVYMAQIMVKPTIAGSVVLQFAIVLALPINSAINPYLYTVSSPTFIRSAKHRIIKWGCVTRIVPNNTKEIEIGINKDENIGLRTFSSKSNDNITASTKDCLSK